MKCHIFSCKQVINILGFNAPEWFFASNGAILAGCIGAGIYITNTPEACFYISEHSKAEVLVVEGNAQLKKYCTFKKDSLPHLKAIVVYGEDVDAALVEKCAFPVYSWDAFKALGNTVATAQVRVALCCVSTLFFSADYCIKPEFHMILQRTKWLSTRQNCAFADFSCTSIISITLLREQQVDATAEAPRPGNCATLIYTSGTTGPPKAVMISNDNITWTARNVLENYLHLTHEERVVSYLPLSHVAGQLIDIYFVMLLGACTYFAQPDALKGMPYIIIGSVDSNVRRMS